MLNKIISNFSCEYNREIETFLKKDSVEFAKKKTAMTFLIFDDNIKLLGYFTLALKSVSISTNAISINTSKWLKQYVKPDDKNNFNVPLYLIAQFGKNYCNKTTCGKDLFVEAEKIIYNVQKSVGGIILMAEWTEKDILLDFYINKFNYVKYSERTDSNNIKYIQMIKLI